MMIRLVLATDLANHFEFLSRINTKLDALEAVANMSPNSAAAAIPAAPVLDMLVIMECAIKIGDVSNGARSLHV